MMNAATVSVLTNVCCRNPEKEHCQQSRNRERYMYHSLSLRCAHQIFFFASFLSDNFAQSLHGMPSSGCKPRLLSRGLIMLRHWLRLLFFPGIH